ncbi:hypothetical protein BUALT_Bualt06G0080900 [Buddleja alternifolia]|uniref:Uncharacterized protein n=1 Tax=Buddleja alternifolia TaxID=168488 RepID=A0AAV6XDR8_9LAMI|nr:hypothetical protein BUALT_Bualt06G0080900 [Buddleja alternifolia]
MKGYLCAWGNDTASEVLTEARLLLVENYFQTPSWARVLPEPSRISGRAPSNTGGSNSELHSLFETLADTYSNLNGYLCAWGNDAASEVLTEARLLLVENYFQTPSWARVFPEPLRIS